MNRAGPLLAVFVDLTAGLSPAEPASAQARRGFRFGIAVPLERTGVTHQKAVDNTDPGILVPAPRRGEIFEDDGSASGPSAGLAFLATRGRPRGQGIPHATEDDPGKGLPPQDQSAGRAER